MKHKLTEKKPQQQKSLAARFFLRMISFYQKNISSQTPACCRYTPTCSNYAKDAIVKYGALRGSVLALWRILRCNPFGKGGYDPVPEKNKLGTCKESSEGAISLSKH